MHGIDSGPIAMVRRTLEEIHFTLRCRPAGGPHWLGEEDQGGRVLPSICQTVRKRDGITGVVRDRRWDRYQLQIIGSNRGGGGGVEDTLRQPHPGSGCMHNSGHGVRGCLLVMVVIEI